MAIYFSSENLKTEVVQKIIKALARILARVYGGCDLLLRVIEGNCEFPRTRLDFFDGASNGFDETLKRTRLCEMLKRKAYCESDKSFSSAAMFIE